MNDTLLENILSEEDTPVYLWDFYEIDRDIRIYYKREDEDELWGFDFYVLSWSGGDCEWSPNNTEVEVLYHGKALFDGIRHLYMGSTQTDNKGYLYYPKTLRHISIFTHLMRMERKYCSAPHHMSTLTNGKTTPSTS